MKHKDNRYKKILNIIQRHYRWIEFIVVRREIFLENLNNIFGQTIYKKYRKVVNYQKCCKLSLEDGRSIQQLVVRGINNRNETDCLN